jgi:NAD(P)-dependent dehydrogenase (short-subunit alcohol dehydrogenase family)
VVRTNLLGPYHLTRAVWPVMAAQGYGRILNVSSNAVLGMGRSAPYAMSKAGLIGLTVDNAREGEALGIRVNAVMPTAYSRMIEAAPDKAFVAWMKANMPAELLVPPVLYLVSRDCAVSGQVFSIGGGRFARVAPTASRGIDDIALSPEAARDRIAEASSMDDPILLNTHADALRIVGMGRS